MFHCSTTHFWRCLHCDLFNLKWSWWHRMYKGHRKSFKLHCNRLSVIYLNKHGRHTYQRSSRWCQTGSTWSRSRRVPPHTDDPFPNRKDPVDLNRLLVEAESWWRRCDRCEKNHQWQNPRRGMGKGRGGALRLGNTSCPHGSTWKYKSVKKYELKKINMCSSDIPEQKAL